MIYIILLISQPSFADDEQRKLFDSSSEVEVGVLRCTLYDTIRYDTIEEFNVDWKAEYSALSSTRSQKKKLKQPTPVPL